MKLLTWCAAPALAVLAMGCSSSNGSNGADGGVDLVTEVPCSQETRATPFYAGMSEMTPNGTVIKIMDATPAPPVVGQTPSGEYNVWTLQVSTPEGGAMPDAKVAVAPYMPDHNHNSPITPSVKSNGDGTYSVRRVDFNMHGFWQITVSVQTAAGTEKAVFPICAD